MDGDEEDCGEARIGRAEGDRLLGADRVEHRLRVVGPPLPARKCIVGHRIGRPGISPVEHDWSTERREALQERGVGRPVPPEIDALARCRGEDEIDGTLTEHLVGDSVSVERRVPSFWHLGVTSDQIDWLHRTIEVDRQIILRSGVPPTFGPPKTAASRRTIPLADVTLQALAEHVRLFPPGVPGLVFTNDRKEPIRRARFSDIWRPAVIAAGVPAGTTYHSLRHHYASLLIHGGESVRTVQARLGHASATETLDTYAHLWPDSEDRTRTAVDSAWRRAPSLRPAVQA